MEEADTVWEKSIDEYDQKEPDPAGSVFFRVNIKETVTRTYLTTDPTLKTAKAVRQQYGEMDTDGWQEMDSTDWDGSRISKVEKVVYSPCSLALEYLTPPQEWMDKEHPKHQQTRYLTSSTMFDEQPESNGSVFNSNRIYRKYARCTTYIHGKTSQICPRCLRRIKEGWSIITPLKKENSQ